MSAGTKTAAGGGPLGDRNFTSQPSCLNELFQAIEWTIPSQEPFHFEILPWPLVHICCIDSDTLLINPDISLWKGQIYHKRAARRSQQEATTAAPFWNVPHSLLPRAWPAAPQPLQLHGEDSSFQKTTERASNPYCPLEKFLQKSSICRRPQKTPLPRSALPSHCKANYLFAEYFERQAFQILPLWGDTWWCCEHWLKHWYPHNFANSYSTLQNRGHMPANESKSCILQSNSRSSFKSKWQLCLLSTGLPIIRDTSFYFS